MENSPIIQLRTFDDVFGDGEISSPTGLFFIPGVNVFLTVSDSSSGMTAISSREEEVVDNLSLDFPSSIQTINVALDPQFNRLLGLNPSGNKLIEIQADSSGNFSQSTQREIDVKSLGIKNARGISVASDGTLYVLDGAAKEILRSEPSADGSFKESTISRIEIPSEIGNPRGIAVNSNTGNLHIYSDSQQELYEVSPQGEVIAVRDFSDLGIRQPEAFVFAPSGDLTDNPNQLSLYVADGASNSGGIVELSWGQLNESGASEQLDPCAAPPLVQTIDTSAFSPSSPDPAGIAFLNFSNTLLISDSEVNEQPFFGTENLFEISLAGNLVGTSSILDFSREPTGVDLNPANQHLFISNDDADEIVEFDTANDSIINIIDTTTFGSFDAEGVAFASNLGTLFVADGVNSEIYQISTDGTLLSSFDTASLGVVDPEGIEYDPSSGNLYIIGNPVNTVLEVTTSGSFVSTLDISAANPVKPAGLALAPSSQNSSETSLYISDRGIDNNADPTENDGRVYEFSLAAAPPPPPPTEFSTIFVSSNTSGTVGGVSFSDEDILAFDTASETWSLLFDGSDVGLGVSSADLNAFHLNSDGSILLSLNQTFTLPDVGSVDENDIVRFIPTSTGSTTAGSYEFYFDGSDVGLSGSPEDIDAIAFTTDDRLLISTSGSVNVTGASGSDEDLLVFNATSLGETTSGTWSLFADNSDVGLGDNGGEDINASFVDDNGDIYLSTNGAFQVVGLSGDSSDIFSFTPSSLGDNTSGTFNSFWDGSQNGFGGENIDGLSLV